MTEEEIKFYKAEIDLMTHSAMARLWRFAPPGHIYFRGDLPLFDHFKARFEKLGGMTPSISKQIGLMKTG